MRVLVTGSNGLCGSAIRRVSKTTDHDFIFTTRADADLTNWDQVNNMFGRYNPDCVIHTAAKVGGVGMNRDIPYTLCAENLQINLNVIQACLRYSVEQLMAFSSVCVFPDDISILHENNMHNGPAYDGTFGYAYSKRMIDTLIRSVCVEYGYKNWTSIIPGNIYGCNDLFDIQHGHVIPTLIHKMYLAKRDRTPFTVWGDGNSLREFIFVDDLARALADAIGRDMPQRLIISGDKEQSIREVVDTLCEITDYHNVVWDASKPNGQRCRPTSKSRFREFFPDFRYTSIREGLYNTWDWFCKNYPDVRMSY